MPSSYRIDQRQLMAELSASDPILKKVAGEVMKEAFFDPAVEQLQRDFEKSKVTQEIAGGAGATNISRTLEGKFQDKEDDDVSPNLWGFIGFDANEMSPEEVLAPIRERLDPSHPDGPKLTYVGRDKDKMVYRYRIDAPNEEAIFEDERTSLFWSPGTSWVRRIEQGIPGIAYFLNVNRGRSGSGVQAKGVVRSGRFRPVSYISRMLNNFLRRAVGRSDNGRAV